VDALKPEMRISVVVPVLNEEQSIRALLDGLLNQIRPPEEIVIIDGGSTDATPRIVEQYATLTTKVRLICEAHALPGRGRNVGAANASHEWLAFIDAGVRPATDWLTKIAERAESDPAVDVVYGAWEPVTDSFFKECAAIAYAYVPSNGVDENSRAILSSLMRRSVWQEVGGFSEHLRSAEDLLFMRKIDDGGFKIAYAPAAVVSWNLPSSLGRTFKRFFTYSRNNLTAGLGRQWQLAILLRYLFVLVLAVLFYLVTTWWLLASAVLLLLMFVARSTAVLWRNRVRFPASAGRNVLRVVVLIPLLITLDAATIAGTIDWLLRDKLLR
jgi:glycosyltransferase involved in cell wall biosynthesis